ncbi:MAG: PQQ-binding-like beta-propeller repeat protein [Planctomycetes bacterium]|nr:PQQ-binding-like beta-propeller repeat protein [Planctomycetota bacterium]
MLSKRRSRVASFLFVLCTIGICSLQLPARPPAKVKAVDPDLIGELLGDVPIYKGVISILGGDDGVLMLELGRLGGYLVHVWEPLAERAAELAELADQAGLYGRDVIVERGSISRLPYAENTVDLVLALDVGSGGLEALSPAEILRSLRPRGRALIGALTRGNSASPLSASVLRAWVAKSFAGSDTSIRESELGIWAVITKPPLEGVDDWSHWEHGPDNNPVSNDQVIKAPYMTQWLGKPYYIAMPAITTAAAGRIFLAMGHIAHHEREEPWLNTLMARNGYNGTVLWTRKLPDGYLVHRSAFIATASAVYMIDMAGAGCLLLDPENGDELGRIDLRGVRGQWKWIAHQGGKLYALIGDKKDPPQTTIVRSKLPHWSWGELSKGYYDHRVPWGFGHTLVAIDLSTKKIVWRHRSGKPIDSRAMVMGGGKVFIYSPDERLLALDSATGEEVWANDDPELRRLIEQPGRGLTSTPGFRTMTFSLYSPDALVFQAQTRMNVVAVSPHNGRKLWSRKKTTNNPNPLWVGDNLLVGIGERGETLAVEAASGDTLATLNFAKQACARLTATSDSLFCRGWPEGLTRFDRYTRKVSYNGAVRPSCNDGVIAANGLLYTGPWLCDCNLTLMGRVVMCSAGDFKFDRLATEAENLEVAVDAASIQPLEVTEADWSTYRGNNSRGASSPVALPESMYRLWESTPDASFQPTTLATAAGWLFYAGGDGKVRAREIASSDLKWTFLTGGPILQPPSVDDGRVFVGSGDGYIYALEATTGRLLWRFRAAPVERRIPVYGRMSSTWPVNSGVLAQDGVVYAAAGVIDYDGTYVYALDAKSGKIKWQNVTSGHLNPALRKGVAAQGVLTIVKGRLWLAGGNIISPAPYDLQTGEYVGPAVRDGAPQSNRGEEIGVFLDRYILVGGRLRYSAARNVINPGFFEAHTISDERETKRARLVKGKIAPAWNSEYAVVVDGWQAAPKCFDAKLLSAALARGDRVSDLAPFSVAEALGGTNVVALALAPNAILAVTEKSESRRLSTRWILSAIDPQSGTIRWEQSLNHSVRSGGLAVDRLGRILLVGEDGSLTCFGGSDEYERLLTSIPKLAAEGPEGERKALVQLRRIVQYSHGEDVLLPALEMYRNLGQRLDGPASKNGAVVIWRIAGPVPWDDKNSVDKVFLDEPNVDIERSKKVEGHDIRWRLCVTEDLMGQLELVRYLGPAPAVACYAYAEVRLEKDQEMHLKLGSNDGFKCWFNGEELGKTETGRGYAPDTDIFRVQGRAGVNKILVKVLQMGNNWAVGVRLTDENNRPISFTQHLPE